MMRDGLLNCRMFLPDSRTTQIIFVSENTACGDFNQTYCGNHFAIYVVNHCCTPETNVSSQLYCNLKNYMCIYDITDTSSILVELSSGLQLIHLH